MDPKKRSWLVFLISLISFGMLSFLLPNVEIDRSLVEVVLSITSILFGLLAGFFISQMWEKFSNVRKHSAEYETDLLNWIRAMRFLDDNEEVKKKFKDRMEEYLVVWITLPWHYADKDKKYFKRVHDLLDEIEISSEKEKVLYEKILSFASQTTRARKKLTILGKQKMFGIEWLILVSLSGIIIGSTFMLREGSLLFYLVAAIYPSIVILILLILYDLNNLKWNVTNVSFEPAEVPLDELGVKRFYEKKALETLDIDIPENKEYRTEDELKGGTRKVYKEIDKKGWNKYKEQY